MRNEKRKLPRFEPSFLDIEISWSDYELLGRILDSSLGGLAVDLPEDANLPEIGTIVNLTVITIPPNEAKIAVGDATVMRSWSEEGLFQDGKGIALLFENELPDDSKNNQLLRGIKQKTRLASQEKLVFTDIEYLSDYRRDLISCQIRLFVLVLTIGVALASAYFGLTYHSVSTSQLNNPNLSFWRTMIAALPGGLTIACALMVAQKSISIQRVDSYLIVLKECIIRGQYPREYRGWDTEIRKFRHVLNTSVCVSCKPKRKCGELKPNDQQKLKVQKMFWNPQIDLYHIIIYSSFFMIFGLSIIAVLTELLKYQLGVPLYMIIASGITIFLIIAALGLFYVFYHLRKGKFSVNYYKRCWIDMLNRCRQPV